MKSIRPQPPVKAQALRPLPYVIATLLAFFVLIALGTQSFARSAPDSFADLAERLLPAVVNISTTQTVEAHGQLPQGVPDFFREFFERRGQPLPDPGPRRSTSLGSGFIIDAKEGYVVTNNHVIQEADEIRIVLHDNEILEAELIGSDPKTDIALLKVDPSKVKLKEVSLGDSANIRVGDWVVAIGNPFGLGGSVTAGIVSARGRNIQAGPYDDFIQTDAAINKGNSGGPLFNLNGDVVGINTAIYSPSGGSVGIGFAVPSNIAKNVIADLKEYGRTRRGWLGVHIQTVSDEIAENLGLKKTMGALVTEVAKGGPAEKAGIQKGDVILTFNGKDVSEMRKLPRIVAETEVGKSVEVEVWRKERKKELEVTVGELEIAEEKGMTPSPKKTSSNETRIDELGMTLAGITARLSEEFNLPDDAKGVLIIGVDDTGPAAEKGIRPGEIILEVSQKEVENPSQIAESVKSALNNKQKSLLLLLKGEGGMRFVAVRLDQ